MQIDKKILKGAFKYIYGCNEDTLNFQYERYDKLICKHKDYFGENYLHFFSAPGRTELGGNHTDHNNGRVLAASVNMDAIAVCSTNDTYEVKIFSEGYDNAFIVNLNELKKKREEEVTTNALIRGIAFQFAELDFQIGGFNAFVSSEVLTGSGLSSSASIEVLIGTIFNALYNENKIPAKQIAVIGQSAENNYFGKPCGLMDQIASAFGGIISIDFENPHDPKVETIDFDFESADYKIIVVNTGGSHADLTDDYASIPNEMKSVAKVFNKESCRDISMNEILSNCKMLRTKVGDRAILRAIHFIEENENVVHQVSALRRNDFSKYLELVNQSGNSSFKWLQNIYSPKNVSEQGVSLALGITERYIDEIGEGACRVHGGGFAGTIQVFLPVEKVEGYLKTIELVFGAGSAKILTIRTAGAVYINDYLNYQ
jgi:galactokinase